ncbi:unnamed protein product [Phaeothamnion confervicola]
MAVSSFESWLEEDLGRLNLDAEVFSGYVAGIMDDPEVPVEERVAAVNELLSGATEEVGMMVN